MEYTYPDPLVKCRPTGHMNVFMHESTQSSSHVITNLSVVSSIFYF